MYSAVKELYKMQIERDIVRLNRVTIGLISAEFREDTVVLNFGGGISSEHSYSEAKAYVSGMCMGVIETDVNKGHTIMRDYI